MKLSQRLAGVVGGLIIGLGAAVQGAAALAVLDALPTAETLGTGWTRDISVLFDPVGTSGELFTPASRLSESFKKEQREAVQNPTNQVSGWTHTHFWLQSTNSSRHYEVQIERYRNQDQLKAGFDRLLAFDSPGYEKKPVEGVGDAAVFFRKLDGGATLWFRRVDFRVWISSVGTVTNWAQDGHLQHLTTNLDRRIVAGTAQRLAPSQPGAKGGI